MSTDPSVTAHLSQTDRPARRAMPDQTTPDTTEDVTMRASVYVEMLAQIEELRERVTALTSERDAAVRIARGNSRALDAAQADLRRLRPDPHDGDSDRSTGTLDGGNGAPSAGPDLARLSRAIVRDHLETPVQLIEHLPRSFYDRLTDDELSELSDRVRALLAEVIGKTEVQP